MSIQDLPRAALLQIRAAMIDSDRRGDFRRKIQSFVGLAVKGQMPMSVLDDIERDCPEFASLIDRARAEIERNAR